VVGLGLYQGMKFVFQRNPWEIVRKMSLGFSMPNNSLRLISCSKVFEFSLGPDSKENAGVLLDLLESPP
jgi:hypothetical protein